MPESFSTDFSKIIQLLKLEYFEKLVIFLITLICINAKISTVMVISKVGFILKTVERGEKTWQLMDKG